MHDAPEEKLKESFFTVYTLTASSWKYLVYVFKYIQVPSWLCMLEKPLVVAAAASII